MPNDTYFDNFNGVVWVQPGGPNTISYPLLCSDLDGIDEPQGDVTGRFCQRADGTWETVNRTQGTPGEVTGDVMSWRANTRAWLAKVAADRCPVGIYVHHFHCGRADTFLNYESGQLLANSFVTSKASSQNARRRADEGEGAEKNEQTFSLSAQPLSEEYWKLVGTVTDAQDSDNPLRDIITCTTPQCLGPCGSKEAACKYLQVGEDATSAGATANTYYSSDYAATWTTGGTDPLAAGEDIASLTCFEVDSDTNRIIAALGTTRGTPMVINYSDDGGATWAGEVTVGSTNGEYALHSGALFSLDARHIWLCTDQANVYFSSDGGLSWTAQSVPDAGASEGLYYVHFKDANYGWSVGGQAATSGHFIQTTDGGAHWALATAEPEAKEGVWVSVIDNNRVWCGTDSGINVWYTNDWGATWTERNLPSAPTETGDGRFIDEYCGFIGGYRTATYKYPAIYRTFDGGYEWEVYTHTTSFSTTPTYYGINAIQVCGYNKVHAVGEQLTGGHSIVWTLKPAGETWD